MKKINIPAFGETEYFESRENAHSTVVTFPHADSSAFSEYCKLFGSCGWERKEYRRTDTHLYAAYSDGENALFLNYFSAVRELSVVMETDCGYFSYSDRPRSTAATPEITQLELEDFGMSYAVRLSDGRFLVIDGGRDFVTDRQRLYRHLKDRSVHEKPVIAAWILTHPHPDHFHLFVGFLEDHADDVVLEKCIFNFPECGDFAHYPALADKDARFDYDNSAPVFIPKMQEQINRAGASVYTAHTGQIYPIGDAVCEILASMDDTIHLSNNINAASLVIRMELAGQVILWAADAPFSISKLPEKYGDYLQADILQVPHHGFQSGSAESEIRSYKLIRPKVCLLPVSDYNAYTIFCTYKESTRFLMTKAGIGELITGTPTRTIPLPYTPPPYAVKELERKYLSGLDRCGATAWIFTELHTEVAEDFRFTLLNTTTFKTTVWIELFFEDPARNVRFIKTEVPGNAMRKISIAGDCVDPDALHFNWLSLKVQGIPENASFSARFTCDVPIVVSHQTHRAAYYSPNR